jgi:hypothetical protein
MVEVVDQLNLQLKFAIHDYLMKDLAKLPDESELAAIQFFSARFEKRMWRLIKKMLVAEANRQSPEIANPSFSRIRSLSHAKKRLLLAAIILAVLISIMSITAAREAVIGFFVEIFEKYSIISFPAEPNQPISTTLPSNEDDIRDILPTVLPDGYSLDDIQVSVESIFATYSNATKGDVLVFERILFENLKMQIDTESITTNEISIGQIHGLFYSNKGVQHLIWREGPFAYIISGKITKNELVKMADSTNRSNN